MTPRRRDLLASVAIGTAVAGCLAAPDGDTGGDPGGENSTDHDRTPNVGADLDALTDEIVDGQATFALDLYRSVVNAEGENLAVSPYSVLAALGMTYAGARGETKREMEEAMRAGATDADFHEAMAALEAELDGRDRTSEGRSVDEDDGNEEELAVQLSIANALWGRAGLGFLESYLDTVEQSYGAELSELDFAGDPEGAIETINDWVAERTEGMIEALLPPGAVGANTVLVLTNALYFYANWATPFDDADTEPRPFTSLAGDSREVATMHHPRETFPYAEVDGDQLLELPYEGDELGMVLVLPEQGTFQNFEQQLTTGRLWTLLGELESTPVDAAIPRFETGANVSLSEHLQSMGMETAFGSEADFSGMVEGGGIWIDEVAHEAVVDVDEDGTEAAAATAVEMITSAPPEPEATFVADRPFCYFIRDRPTETILFAGRVVDHDALKLTAG